MKLSCDVCGSLKGPRLMGRPGRWNSRFTTMESAHPQRLSLQSLGVPSGPFPLLAPPKRDNISSARVRSCVLQRRRNLLILCYNSNGGLQRCCGAGMVRGCQQLSMVYYVEIFVLNCLKGYCAALNHYRSCSPPCVSVFISTCVWDIGT